MASDNQHSLLIEILRKLYRREAAARKAAEDGVKIPDSQRAGAFLNAMQIASLVLGAGNSKNAAKIQSVLSAFYMYFDSVGSHPYKLYRPRCERVRRDFPEVEAKNFTSKVGSPTSIFSPDKFCDSAIKATEQEYAAVAESVRKNPILVHSYKLLDKGFDIDGNPVYFYEASLWYEHDEMPGVPEGVTVSIVWPELPVELKAKLLVWDLPQNRVILRFAAQLSPLQKGRESYLLVTMHELLGPLRDSLRTIRGMKQLLCWRILEGTAGESVPYPQRAELMSGLDSSQQAAVANAVGHDFSVIWGPPGTGKTFTLAHIVCQLALLGRRVLVTSTANVAVDNVAIAFARLVATCFRELIDDMEDGRFVRYGYTKRADLLEYKKLFPITTAVFEITTEIKELRAQLMEIRKEATSHRARIIDRLSDLEKKLKQVTQYYLTHAQVVFTTATQASADSIISIPESFDCVAIDESSMVSLTSFAVCASRAKRQVIVAGDFKQLAPVAVSMSSDSMRYMHRSIFEHLGLDKKLDFPGMKMLMQQRRMHPQISNCISESFYFSRLKDAPEILERTSKDVMKLRPLVFRDLSRENAVSHDYRAILTKSGSRANEASARYVAELAFALHSAHPDLDVAVITPYRQQSLRIRQLIDEQGKTDPKRVRTGTIHTFQGSEADVVIWDMVDTQESGLGRLYRSETGARLANVGLSRARRQLIVTGDGRLLSADERYYGEFPMIRILGRYF